MTTYRKETTHEGLFAKVILCFDKHRTFTALCDALDALYPITDDMDRLNEPDSDPRWAMRHACEASWHVGHNEKSLFPLEAIGQKGTWKITVEFTPEED